MANNPTIETTLGDLIVALTEEASLFVPDHEAACRVVAYILSDILLHSDPPTRSWH